MCILLCLYVCITSVSVCLCICLSVSVTAVCDNMCFCLQLAQPLYEEIDSLREALNHVRNRASAMSAMAMAGYVCVCVCLCVFVGYAFHGTFQWYILCV